MSEVFDKSCYTTRSTGYKYRTLATNTGETKRRKSEENILDRKIAELKEAVSSRVNSQLFETQKSRDALIRKIDQVTSKIDALVSVNDEVMGLRKSMYVVENKLADLMDRVDRIVLFSQASEECCVRSLNENIDRSRADVAGKPYDETTTTGNSDRSDTSSRILSKNSQTPLYRL